MVGDDLAPPLQGITRVGVALGDPLGDPLGVPREVGHLRMMALTDKGDGELVLAPKAEKEGCRTRRRSATWRRPIFIGLLQ